MSTVSRARAITRPADRHTQSAGRASMELQTAYSTRRRSDLSDLRTATLEPSDKPIPASGDCTLPKLTGERAKATWPLSWPRARRAFRRAFRLVRWKMVTIITFTFGSTFLVACLAVATLNVVLRRESTNVIEKQISTLV